MLGIHGFGVLVRAEWDTRDAIAAGELVQILKDHPLDDYGSIYAVMKTGAAYLPLDLYALANHHGWHTWAVLILNLIVVAVLARDLVKRRK